LSCEEEWIKFVRGQFPRAVGFERKGEPFIRHVVLDKDYYLYDIWKYLNTHHCWAAVYSEASIQKNLFDCLPFDFDGHEHSLEKALKEAKDFYSYLKEVYNYEPRLYFSGRGVHLYIDIKPVELKHFKTVARKFYSSVRQILQSDTLDFSIVGDKRRIMRIPYTMHISVKQYCVPIDYSWNLKTVLNKSSKPDYSKEQTFEITNSIRKILIDYDEEANNKPIQKKHELELKGARKDRLKLELDMIYKYAPTTEDHRHRILHFMLVPRLILIGQTDDEIRAACKGYIESTWGGKLYNDYSQYVEDSIKRTRAGKWMPWKIETFVLNFPDAARWFKKSQ